MRIEIGNIKILFFIITGTYLLFLLFTFVKLCLKTLSFLV